MISWKEGRLFTWNDIVVCSLADSYVDASARDAVTGDSLLGWLGGTTGSASDQSKVVCITVLTGNRMGVNCSLWPAATLSSEL